MECTLYPTHHHDHGSWTLPVELNWSKREAGWSIRCCRRCYCLLPLSSRASECGATFYHIQPPSLRASQAWGLIAQKRAFFLSHFHCFQPRQYVVLPACPALHVLNNEHSNICLEKSVFIFNCLTLNWLQLLETALHFKC